MAVKIKKYSIDKLLKIKKTELDEHINAAFKDRNKPIGEMEGFIKNTINFVEGGK